MINYEIKSLIEDNYSLIGKIQFKILEKYKSNLDANEILAALKVNELILIELKYKENFNNEGNVIKVLKKMYSNLNFELLRIS